MAKTTKKTRKKPSSADPVTGYARDVVAGRIVAGPHVRDACARHLRDLVDGPHRGLVWDLAAALKAIAFFETVLKLNSGEFEGVPFLLLGWQKFIVGSLFGWKNADGYRRFRKAYIETGKGSGKSPLLAGCGIYMMAADGEAGAEVYAAATAKDQAHVLFRDAVSMCRQSPALSKRVTFSGGEGKEWNIAYIAKGSFFRPISSESRGRGKSGFRPHCVLLDELHEHPTDAMVEFMAKGIKKRRQPLILMITNSGSDRQTVCWEYHEYGAKVSAGTLQDDRFFAYICALDEGDDPLKDEGCWEKANPSLRITPGLDYLRGEVQQARGMPSKQNLTLRLNFCVWTESESAWIGADAWKACEYDLDLEALAEFDCYGGLDLAAKLDLTAGARAWRAPDGCVYAMVEFWKPNDTLGACQDRDKVPYQHWRDEGYLRTTPNKAVDYGFVARRMGEMHAESRFVEVAYDRQFVSFFQKELDTAGIELPMVEFGQGYLSMAPAITAIEELIVNDQLRVQYNPVLRWNVASAVTVSDDAGNRKFTKRKATGRIDGLIALVMAVARAVAAPVPQKSIYETRGFRSV